MIFAKGHGTENDFVILPDLDAAVALSQRQIVALCDRRRGLGSDGVIRVTTAGAVVAAGVLSSLPDGVSADDWYMDYRNSDGSFAEMCGNGVRVFAHYLRASGLEKRDAFVVGSLAGPRSVVVHHADAVSAEVTVDMGPATRIGSGDSRFEAVVGGRRFAGLGVDVGNPHLACVATDLTPDLLAELDVAAPVEFDHGQFLDGVNVEILTPLTGGPIRPMVHMRVHERGAGETRSCGTGVVAAAVAALAQQGVDTGELTVRVPGGDITVTITPSTSFLRGPSVLVARGDIADQWWNALT